jgi:hypothetical protein
MSQFGHKRERGRKRTRAHWRVRQQVREKLIEDSEELEQEQTYTTSHRTGGNGHTSWTADDDEIEADAVLEESGDGAVDEDAADAVLEDDAAESMPQRRWTIREIVGSRPPVVLARVLCEPPESVTICVQSPTESSKNSVLERLRCFLQDRFEAGLSLLSPTEWQELTGQVLAQPLRRQLLLNRLAVSGEHKFPNAEGHESAVSELGLERYRYKLAALPDGMPFSIGLLVAGGDSGNKGQGETAEEFAFHRLPMAVRLLAWRQTLRLEQEMFDQKEIAKTWSDVELAARLRETAQKACGLDLPEIDVARLRRFRDELKREAERRPEGAREQSELLRLAWNRSERQQQYQGAPAAASSSTSD